MVQLGRTWSNLGEHGRTWSNLGEHGRIWANMVELKRTWANMVEHWRIRSKMVELGRTWSNKPFVCLELESVCCCCSCCCCCFHHWSSFLIPKIVILDFKCMPNFNAWFHKNSNRWKAAGFRSWLAIPDPTGARSTAAKRLGQFFVLFREISGVISFTMKWNHEQGYTIIIIYIIYPRHPDKIAMTQQVNKSEFAHFQILRSF